MKLENCYYLEYLDYWPDLYNYNHNVSANISSAFFRCFMSNLGVHSESQTEPLIWTTGVNCSNSVNHDQIRVLSCSKYSLLVLPVARIEPVTSRWFHLAVSNQTPYPLHNVSLPKIFVHLEKIFFKFGYYIICEGHLNLSGIRPNEKISKLFPPTRIEKELPYLDSALWDLQGLEERRHIGDVKRDLKSTMTPRCTHLTGAHKVTTILFPVNQSVSLSVVNKSDCFFVHSQICLFSVLFTYFLCL